MVHQSIAAIAANDLEMELDDQLHHNLEDNDEPEEHSKKKAGRNNNVETFANVSVVSSLSHTKDYQTLAIAGET